MIAYANRLSASAVIDISKHTNQKNQLVSVAMCIVNCPNMVGMLLDPILIVKKNLQIGEKLV
jgi:hypothetical protein